MSFTKVSDLLGHVAQRSGDPTVMEAAYVVERAQKEIGKMLGERAIGFVRAQYFKDGILTFAVASSVWAHDVRMRERKILYHLHGVFGKRIVQKIRYKVGQEHLE